jgi:hypothetical protein
MILGTEEGFKMVHYKYIPHHQLPKQIGKPVMLRLKSGKELYGSISEVRKNGIMFLPVHVRTRSSSDQAKTKLFFVPIFVPFAFFVPFLIII